MGRLVENRCEEIRGKVTTLCPLEEGQEQEDREAHDGDYLEEAYVLQ